MILTPPPAFLSTDVSHQTPGLAASLQHRLRRFCAEYVLGTRLEILVHSDSYAIAQMAAHAARTEIERLNQVLNDRRRDSELSELQRVRRSNISVDLFAVLQLSEAWRHMSRGAFDGRMGTLVRLWAKDAEPNQAAIAQVLAAVRISTITVDPIERWVELSSAVALSLDAVAKGYIVDAALNAARRAAPTLEGLAISIGGDIRCWGQSPAPRGWRVGIADPTNPAQNAPLIDAVSLNNAAIATSGRGPRDWIGNRCRSTTISPFTGYPVRDVISASIVASHAADADAIATACMVLHPDAGIALADKLDGVAARITEANGRVHQSARWPTLQLVAAVSSQPSQKPTMLHSTIATEATPDADHSAAEKTPSLPPEMRWPADWEIGVTYTEPEVKERDADFRQPYIALWITDAQNKIVNTIFLLGKDAKYHHDNFIWWGSYNERAEHEVELRSQGTTLSGRYQIFWIGVDDEWNRVPIGKYNLHLETSQEHGKHSYRTVPIEIGRERFKLSIPNLEDLGGLDITYGHYNDRFKSDG